MLLDAEALVLWQCLAQREGAAFEGELIETQIVGKPVTDALMASKTLPNDLTQVDAYWRRWMALRLQSANAH